MIKSEGVTPGTQHLTGDEVRSQTRMFLDLLAFFGPFVIGGLLSQRLVSERVRTGLYFGAVIAVCIIYEFVAFHVPFRGLWTEVLCLIVGFVVETLILSSAVSEGPDGPIGYRGFLRATPLLLLPFVAFTIVGRVNQAQKMAKKLDGVVQKYAGDHGVPSIVVTQQDGSTASIEGIDPLAWNSIQQGKSHLSKPAWNAFGQLDGKPMRILPKAKVMFLGPFPD